MQREISLIFDLEKEGKTTVRYRERSEKPVVRFIYIPKEFLEGERPKFLRVSLFFMDEEIEK